MKEKLKMIFGMLVIYKKPKEGKYWKRQNESLFPTKLYQEVNAQTQKIRWQSEFNTLLHKKMWFILFKIKYGRWNF